MANKYIDISATYNGDGTSSNQAASAGAAGAWNNFANCLKNTPGYGSIAAGDTIYVRTKNGTDLQQTEGSDLLGASPASQDSVVNWVFDDGTVWPGDDGIFTLYLSGVAVTLPDYNNIYAGTGDTRRFVIYNTHSGTNQIVGAYIGNVVLHNVRFDVSPTSSTNTRMVYYQNRTNGCRAVLINPYFNLYSCNNIAFHPIFVPRDNGGLDLINPTINLNGASNQCVVFSASSYGSKTTVKGGAIINAVVGKHFITTKISSNYFNRFEIEGFDIGNAGILYSYEGSPDYRDYNQVLYTSRVNPFDFIYWTNNGFYEWWDYQNYPTLSATLPNGRPWSVRITPSGARPGNLYGYSQIAKLYTLAAAAKTITCELLIENTYTPTAKEFWINIQYVDNATGDTISLSSFDISGTPLVSSTADWSHTIFGDPAKSFNKYKIQITTPTAIKQYSQVQLQVMVGRAPINALDYFFVDPDMVLS